MVLEKEQNIYSDGLDFETSFDDALILENFSLAKQKLEDFKSKYGESVSYQYKLAQYHRKIGHPKKAYQLFKYLYYDAPIYMKDRFDFEEMQRELIHPKLEKARAMLNQETMKKSNYLEENPGANSSDIVDPEIKGFWLSYQDEIRKVVEIYMQVLDLEPYEVDAAVFLVQCYLELKNKEKVKYYQNQIGESKKHWRQHVKVRTRAVITAKQQQEDGKHYKAVIDIVNLGLITDPTSGELLLSKATALQELGRFLEALDCVNSILKFHPKHAAAFRMKKLIEVHRFSQNMKTGMSFMFQADQIETNSSEQIQKLESALSYFLEALNYDNENLTALAGMYRCYLKTGNPIKAQRALAKIREIDSSFDVHSVFSDAKPTWKKKEEACFVATRVFGATDIRTNFLRNFRDNVLVSFFLGQVFMQFYRRVGPSMAKLSDKGPFLSVTRIILNKVIYIFRN